MNEHNTSCIICRMSRSSTEAFAFVSKVYEAIDTQAAENNLPTAWSNGHRQAAWTAFVSL